MAEGDLYLNVDEALAGAARLAAVGNWRPTWAEHEAAIAAGEASSPWGDDENGAQMKKSYEETAAALRPAGDAFSECYETLADQCRTAVSNFQAADRPRPAK